MWSNWFIGTYHVDGDLAHFRVAMLLTEVLDALLLLRDLLVQDRLEVCAVGGIAHVRRNHREDVLFVGEKKRFD